MKITVYILILLPLTLFTCSIDQSIEPKYVCSGKLLDKNVDQIKYCLTGRWKYEYSIGGMTGEKYYFTTDSYLEFRAVDSLYQITGETVTKNAFDWKPVLFRGTDSTYEISVLNLVVHGIYQDSLVLTDNAIDAPSFVLSPSNSNY